jgi:hypothetical protein
MKFTSSLLTICFIYLGCSHNVEAVNVNTPAEAVALTPAPPKVPKPPKPCSPQTGVGDECEISPMTVHPTQFALGLRDVEHKRIKISKLKNAPVELDEYLHNGAMAAIKGPDELFYLIDGHHRTRAIAEEDMPFIYITVKKDFSDLTMTEFLDRMVQNQYVWLYDENGERHSSPIDIPNSIMDLKDDPYRSLAEDALNDGAYDATDTLFQQFYWANFLRTKISKSTIDGDYDVAKREADLACQSEEASTLPGYHGKK